MKQLVDLKKEILAGKVFIYPTDTIYGLGCNALDIGAVERIKDIKGGDRDKPMSVIAPSMDWIKENCVVPDFANSQFGFEGHRNRFTFDDNMKPTHLPKIVKSKSPTDSASGNPFLSKYLPGAYTLILKKKNKNFLSHVSSNDAIGVRIPDCEFTAKVQEAGVPVITTSVNLSGEKPANKILDISEDILNSVDFAFDYGELSGKASTLIIGDKEIER